MIRSYCRTMSSARELESLLRMVFNLKWHSKLTFLSDSSSSHPWSMAAFRRVNKTFSARPLFVITPYTNLFTSAWVLCRNPSWALRWHDFWHKLQNTHTNDHVFAEAHQCRYKLRVLGLQTVSPQFMVHYYATNSSFPRTYTFRALRMWIFS